MMKLHDEPMRRYAHFRGFLIGILVGTHVHHWASDEPNGVSTRVFIFRIVVMVGVAITFWLDLRERQK